MKVECSVASGTELSIVVGEGGKGGSVNQHQNFGGGGQGGGQYHVYFAGGGGGLSGVFTGNPWTQANALIVAGAGGGASGAHAGHGGGGGYPAGQDGAGGYSADNPPLCNGKGGSATAGGAKGTNGRNGRGTDGVALAGGNGRNAVAGGGGSGWWGGGGASGYYCSGGGGSSWFKSGTCTLLKSVDGQVGSGVAHSDHPSKSFDSEYVSGAAVAGNYGQNAGNGYVVLEFPQ